METDDGTAPTEFSRYYDPDQAPEVRRKVRKEYHDLARRFYGKCTATCAFRKADLANVHSQ